MKQSLRYYSYKPRLRLQSIVDIPELQKGDEILVPRNWFSEIGKEHKETMISGLYFKVVKRTLNCVYWKGPLIALELELIENEKT